MHRTNQVCRLVMHIYHAPLKFSSVHQHAFTILSICPSVLSDKSNTRELACSVPMPLTFQPVLSTNVGDVELSLTVEVLCLQLANRLVTALVQIAMALCKLNAHKIMCTLCSQLWKSSGSSCTACCSTSTSCRSSVDCPRMCNPFAIDANAGLLDRVSCRT